MFHYWPAAVRQIYRGIDEMIGRSGVRVDGRESDALVFVPGLLHEGLVEAIAIEVVRAGQILYEIGGLPEAAARDCLARVAYKMPFKCRFVTRRPSI